MDQKHLQQIAEMLWEEYCEIFPELVKFDCPKIELNGRFTVTAGCNSWEDNTVILGKKFFKKFSRNMVRVILPHELAHQIDYNLNHLGNVKTYHGKTWKEIMIKIGQKPLPCHSMEI